MHLFNADGSRAEMSGNGIRCLAQAVALAREATELRVHVGTDAGRPRSRGRRRPIRTTRPPTSRPAWARSGPVPRCPPAVVDRLSQAGQARARRFATADVGNPHLVVEVDDPAAVDLADDGAWIERQFADGINVEFIAPAASVDDDDADRDLRVWERGAGITEACGTGACAAASVFQAWATATAATPPATAAIRWRRRCRCPAATATVTPARPTAKPCWPDRSTTWPRSSSPMPERAAIRPGEPTANARAATSDDEHATAAASATSVAPPAA